MLSTKIAMNLQMGFDPEVELYDKATL